MIICRIKLSTIKAYDEDSQIQYGRRYQQNVNYGYKKKKNEKI